MAQPLIIFDSGIGGFSILKHLRDLPLPIHYFADQKYFPYGDKSESWLQSRLTELAHDFASSNPQMVIVACNTGTTAAISHMREVLSCPVIGVEPIVKQASRFVDAVVWGTQTALNSSRALSLRETHGQHVRYYTPVGLPSAIEYQDEAAITQILSGARADLGVVGAIGLSCTHYPLIQDQIQDVFPEATLLDPAPAVVAHARKILNKRSTIYDLPSAISYSTTGDLLKLQLLAEKYI